MPDRIFRLAAALRAERSPAVSRLLDAFANDNEGPSSGNGADAGPPEPCWDGPGTILSLGTKDGRHGLGAMRALIGEDGDGTPDMNALIRLLAHYGIWLGFEGAVEPIHGGRLRQLPVPVGGRGRVEYQLDVRRIVRSAQRLTADGTILLNGRPAAILEGFSIAFRPQVRSDRDQRRGA
ncbi:hypothetical protein J8J14_15055 [Roseomonas sp. SSH11]|uniref:Uncharacterized protein n=1 Tax=Pararoseomonas baculiformis TaxID=2820812 RepID=A0ABS4AGD5_9PROT|nr:hypothetical protein [Pararoseomonas baculiformis]MBP0446091.1 hypothetical protein [Pararoseomonas baculiformis]